MDVPVTAKAALLQVLLEGPGYGTELADRVRDRTHGRIVLLQGSLYPALRKFEKDGLVETFEADADGQPAEVPNVPTEMPKRAKGKHATRPARIYYRITESGTTEALEQRDSLSKLIGKGTGSPGELTTGEREELTLLRNENRRLREEREILKKATAIFANETK